MFAERLAPELAALEQTVATDPPDDLLKRKTDPEIRRLRELAEFTKRREEARERAPQLRALLFPPDEEVSDG